VPPDRAADLSAAVNAARAAARACRAVQEQMVTPASMQKKDKSPVTVADFASQAIVCALLARAFPSDPVVGEEDAHELREDGQAGLRAAVTARVGSELGRPAPEDEVLAWIDRGGSQARETRYWTLDPIDGTKGFLRNEQYAVALALIEHGEVVLGVLACPSLPASGGGTGALFTAVRGCGAQEFSLADASTPGRAIGVSRVRSAAEARFCESVESAHSDQDESAQIAKLLGITSPPHRIDSQCKYAAVARGDASIYLRMPTRADYREKIWDHAAGKLVVECAGGRVSDIHGRPLDFTRGRNLEENQGVVATCGPIHDAVIDAIRRVRSA
jgi:3'(2'), 5'-bisphosphate nucleotidase